MQKTILKHLKLYFYFLFRHIKPFFRKNSNVFLNHIFLPPATEGWGKVIFSVCLSVHTGTGGGTPVPGSFPGLWSQVLSRGYHSPRFFPRSLILSQVSGPRSFLGEGYPRPFWGYPRTGPRQGWGTPSQDWGTPPWPGLGYPLPQPGLEYPLPSQDWGPPPPPGQVTLRAVGLVRFPAGGLSRDK